MPVTVGAIATTPTLTVHSGTGAEDAPIALLISVGLNGGDAGETVSVTIGGVPAGAVLSAGVHNGDGTWTLTTDQLPGLTPDAAAALQRRD